MSMHGVDAYSIRYVSDMEPRSMESDMPNEMSLELDPAGGDGRQFERH